MELKKLMEHISIIPDYRSPSLVLRRYAVLATVSSSYPPPSGSFPDITHPSATRQLLVILLAVLLP